MTTTITLRPTGPHDDDATRAIAEAFAETVRTLNHATADDDGLTYPATVYDVLADLATGAAGLPQTLFQLRDFVDKELIAGRLGDDHGDPPTATATVRRRLDDAMTLACDLTTALRAAQTATSGLHRREVA